MHRHVQQQCTVQVKQAQPSPPAILTLQVDPGACVTELDILRLCQIDLPVQQ